MTLFDPDEFRSPADKEPKAPRRRREPVAIIRSDGRWHVIATREGPIPFVHRFDPFTPSKLQQDGSVYTRCERVGRVLLTPDPGTAVLPCPECIKRSG